MASSKRITKRDTSNAIRAMLKDSLQKEYDNICASGVILLEKIHKWKLRQLLNKEDYERFLSGQLSDALTDTTSYLSIPTSLYGRVRLQSDGKFTVRAKALRINTSGYWSSDGVFDTSRNLNGVICVPATFRSIHALSHGSDIQLSPELNEQVTDHAKVREDFVEKVSKIAVDAKAICDSEYTVKKLFELWPEIKPYWPGIVESKKAAPVQSKALVKNPEEINSILGLPTD